MIEPESRTDLSTPVFSVGVIADIQYAPIADGFSYAGVKRYYRHSLETARVAFAKFQEDQVPLVVNLGDILDGKCQNLVKYEGDEIPEGVEAGLYALSHVIEAMSVYDSGVVLHAHGNHCLYNLSRDQLASKLGISFVQEPCGEKVGYSSHVLEHVRFIFLDSYDVCKMRPPSSSKYQAAHQTLQENNPNYPEAENSPEDLDGVSRRFVAFNGGIDQLQLEWLRNELELARSRQEVAVLLSHQPIHPLSTSPTCLMWNFEAVLELLREFSDVVALSLAGHAHSGGYNRDCTSGIHFRVIEASLETPSPHNTFAFMDVLEDYIRIRGYGNCLNAEYELNHLGTRK